ncbi:dihydropteroate synthase [Ehrlichia ruminantium]|uniref:dihydropteroate synthase n=1 Tax=Ehrlichia ruminantium TaxID=779 RepID=UPI0007C1398C|nr:dihydropteroate synthase [Ehrlichia ruminantium]QLK52557.1 dihydropteroate synthase [Ehrlichia ruminantium]QLK54387.1 dihydropteroate synthase [Ehrlichia ruminantium]QLK57138.1 dihydropteroate synthase [Ehrlichia ruminantium]UOD97624.1 dihydropteroate synthase [Ehrlichia ruminantium]GAT76480.1 dihydropteroate synthase [Ehrlichia ruminantium]
MKFKTQILGCFNFTPDSFSDGGQFFTVEKAIKQTEHLINSGADIIDVGAESGKPRYIYQGDETLITQEEEWNRLKTILPQIVELAHSRNVKVSLDTRNAKTAEKGLALNVDFINDATGISDSNMIPVLLNSSAKIIISHNLGVPLILGQFIPKGVNPITEIKQWLKDKTTMLINAGINRDRLIVDPGIGCGKNATQSLYIMKNIDKLKELKYPICLGHSRKSCLMQFDPEDKIRDNPTVIASSALFYKNIDFFRVHNAEIHSKAFKVIKTMFQITLKDVYDSL